MSKVASINPPRASGLDPIEDIIADFKAGKSQMIQAVHSPAFFVPAGTHEDWIFEPDACNFGFETRVC